MGLRTASVRRPCVEVMAPALTETAQNQAFKLPPKDHLQPAAHIDAFDKDTKYLPDVPGGTFHKPHDDQTAPISFNTLALVSESLLARCCCSELDQASDAATDIIMSDQNDKMVKKTGLDSVSNLHNNSDKTNDVDRMIDNLGDGDVDEIIEVIKSIENAPANDLNIENNLDVDLPANLTIEKFLTDVDMMNMSMEEDTAATLRESESHDLIDSLKAKQIKLERRLDFVRRKLHKMQARAMGQHISGEVAGVYEYVHRSLKRLKDSTGDALPGDNTAKPMSYGSTKTLLKKLEMAAALQANSVARQKHVPKYFGSGSCETANHRINVPGIVTIPPWPMDQKVELQKVTGLLHTEMRVVQHEVDSEATESSSGGESCDEAQSYTNPHQQYLSIQKRALWKYATSRAAIAARWTWLQAQISDLEYRIRVHTDLHRQVRSGKGDIRLGGPPPPPVSDDSLTMPPAVNGYRGQLPGSSPAASKMAADVGGGVGGGGATTANGAAFAEYQCARTRPLVNFKKRKLLQINGLHIISKKAARPSNVRCGCVQTTVPCAVCTGRTDPTHPRDPPDALSKAERIALVDPAFHPVFSLPDDISYAIHCEAIMKTPEWQQRSTRMKSLKLLKSDRSDKTLLDHRTKKLEHRKKYNRLLKPSTASALSAKIKSKIRGRKIARHSTTSFRKRSSSKGPAHGLVDGIDEEVESIGNNSAAVSNSAAASPSSSPLLHIQAISGYNRRNRANSYDIDNIVIPYSVAAATRVEKLPYKEILTPKWRIAENDFKCDTIKNNGAVRNPSQDSDCLQAEDLSEDAVVVRHDKSEHDEKKKFLSYMKWPIGHGRPRGHKRNDSLAESSGANTPDPQSPHTVELPENTHSPLTSPPATPLPPPGLEDGAPPPMLPSISAMRRRTISQSRFAKDKEVSREENYSPESVEVPPFDARLFPIDEETYDKMLKNMPENHQFKTNARAQDSSEFQPGLSYLDEKVDSPGSESTESAIGEEDPNDPEWVDMERSRDRHKR